MQWKEWDFKKKGILCVFLAKDTKCKCSTKGQKY